MLDIFDPRANAGNSALSLFLLLIKIMIVRFMFSVIVTTELHHERNQGSLEWAVELQRLGSEVSTEAYCILVSDAA
jgi:hypothetical protein